MTAGHFWCDFALVDGEVVSDVAITVVDGRFDSITPNAPTHADATHLNGFTIPGLANAHSHAFQRALRSRTQRGSGSFWTWRDLMYRAADRLDPELYLRLARATFAEMVASGITTVGEFHYLHHGPGGARYEVPNIMGDAVLAAADEAGLRITLLDVLYLHGGLTDGRYLPLSEAQKRFGDGSVDVWADRVGRLTSNDRHRVGAAIHSVRAVDPVAMGECVVWASQQGASLHAHVSEQVAENDECQAIHSMTPVALLESVGALGPAFVAVHATHVNGDDIGLLAESNSAVCLCPTTERDLGDGIVDSRQMVDAGVPIVLGSDSHAVIDLFDEAHAVEMDQRQRTRSRGVHPAGDLLAMATTAGHRSLGWNDVGSLETGQRADLVTVGLDSVRTAGVAAGGLVEATVFAAGAVDVSDVIVDGRHIVSEGQHRHIDVASELSITISELMDR
ncbi:MAG: formimidoylglutamate deiminase [Actinomycetia bacterium]|nr:formimidoylglutamate deiminase [Actinomycetes bacterium]